MMKKLLVLALVLSLVGFVNAGLTVAYDGQKAIVANDEPMAGGINAGLGIIGPAVVTGDLILRPAGAIVMVPAITVYSGPDAIGFGLPYDGGFNNLTWGDATTSTTPDATWAPAGFWFSMALPGYVVSDASKYVVQLDLIDGFGTPLQTLYLDSAIPEPMTMLLLGLGGLFLRKK